MGDALRFLWAALLFAADALYRRLGGREPVPMLATVVPLVWTPFPLADLEDCIQAGHHQHFGSPLWPAALPVVRALMELEHGVVAGQLHGLPNFCWGNFDARDDELGDASVKVFRTVPEREVGAGGSYRQQHWRVASTDAVVGMARWWRVMATGRFSEVVDLLHGDGLPSDATTAQIADAVAAKMKALGYYTSDELSYQRGLERLSAA